MTTSLNHDDVRFKFLPPSMGFEQEEWHDRTVEHGPHYTCIANGVRVCVWVSWGTNHWIVQLASHAYHSSTDWTERTERREVNAGTDPLALMSIIHDLTSGGNTNV